MRNKNHVIILSRNYSNGLAVARSLGRAGYTIHFIASSHKEGANDCARLSRYVDDFREVVSVKVGEDRHDAQLIEAVMDFAGRYEEKPVLFPADDYTVSVMDNARDELSGHFLMPFIADGEAGGIATLMDKSVQAGMARGCGLDVPVTVKVSLREEEIAVPESVTYPCFVKPVRSMEGYKTEMAVCADSAELKESLGKMRERFADRDVVVQEYLDIDQEYASAGVCLDQEIILPALIKKTRKGKHSTGVTLTGELVPFEELGEEVCAAAIDFLKSLRYTGCFGLEFNVAGGRIYFNEVNLRSAGESYAYYNCGVNLPEIFVRALTGEAGGYSEKPFAGFGKTIIYDKIAWEDYVYGNIDREELDDCIASADIDILCDPDDPLPGDAFCEEMLARAAKYKRKTRRRGRRKDCLSESAEDMGWSAEQAEAALDDARERTGITYADYLRHEFWRIPAEEQQERYDEITGKKEERRHRRETEKPLVVVVSRIYSTGLAVIRSLGAAGYTVDYVGNCFKEGGSAIAAASRYVRKSTEIVSRKVGGGGDRALVDALLAYREEKQPGQRIFLFPTDDYTASVMDANRNRLKRIFVMPSVAEGVQGTMVRKMSKSIQSRFARRSGLNVAKEWLVSLREDTIELPEDLVYPCYVKPLESITGYKKEMKKCENAEELLRHLTVLQYRFSDRDILVQEYLDIDYEIDFSGICFDQEIIIPGIIRKTQVAQHDKGVTLAGIVVPFEEIDRSTREAIIRFMKTFRYSGMFDFELIVAGGKIYFNEVNLRSGGPNYAYFMSGINLPAVTVKGLLHQEYDPEELKISEFGKSFIYEKVAYDDYAAGFINKIQLNRMLKKADIRLLESEDDPEPTRLFYETTEEAARKKRVRNRKKTIRKIIRKTGEDKLGDLWLLMRGYPQGRKKNQRDAGADTSRVLIAGRNWCSNLCMAKSVSEGGYEAEVLRIVQRAPRKNNLLRWLRPEMKSRHVKAFYFLNSRRNRLKIVDRLKRIADENRKMLLIPADDLIAYTIDEFYDELEPYYLMPSIRGRGGEVVRLMSKDAQKELAIKAGLPVINSCVISSENKEIIIPESVSYPCFMKPNVSRNSSKRAMLKCESEEELRETLSARLDKGFEVIVEDFVEIKRELSYLGLSTPDGVVIPGYFEAVEEGEGSHRGVAMLGRLLPVDEAEPLISDVKRFIEDLGYYGLFDVDLIETADGKVYFLELNLRYGASGYALTKGGVNLPAMYADYMLKGRPIDMDCRINNEGSTFTSEKVLIDEYREGLIGMKDVMRIMSSADIHFVMDYDDPAPYRHVRRHYITAKRLREKTIAKRQQLEESESE